MSLKWRRRAFVGRKSNVEAVQCKQCFLAGHSMCQMADAYYDLQYVSTAVHSICSVRVPANAMETATKIRITARYAKRHLVLLSLWTILLFRISNSHQSSSLRAWQLFLRASPTWTKKKLFKMRNRSCVFATVGSAEKEISRGSAITH